MEGQLSQKNVIVNWLIAIIKYKLQKGVIKIPESKWLPADKMAQIILPAHSQDFEEECCHAITRISDQDEAYFHTRWEFNCPKCEATSEFKNSEYQMARKVLSETGFTCPSCSTHSDFNILSTRHVYKLKSGTYQIHKPSMLEKLIERILSWFKET